MTRSTIHEAPQYADLSSILVRSPFSVKEFYLAPCSRRSLSYVIPSKATNQVSKHVWKKRQRTIIYIL